MPKNKKQNSEREKKINFIVEALSGADADYMIEDFIKNVLGDITSESDEIIEYVYDCCGGDYWWEVEDDE